LVHQRIAVRDGLAHLGLALCHRTQRLALAALADALDGFEFELETLHRLPWLFSVPWSLLDPHLPQVDFEGFRYSKTRLNVLPCATRQALPARQDFPSKKTHARLTVPVEPVTPLRRYS